MEGLGKYLLQLWEAQQGQCYYTGRKMLLRGYQTEQNAVTVDRKVPALGYVEGNIVLCCSIVNRMKQNLTLGELLELFKELISFTEKSFPLA